MRNFVYNLKFIISSLIVLALVTSCRANLGNIFDIY
jgi:hypothetical protein